MQADDPLHAAPTDADDRRRRGPGDPPAEVARAVAQLLALADTLDQLDLDGVRPACL
jgi:hypothetical protein